MRLLPLVAIALFGSSHFVASAHADCPPCGPLYCLNDSAFPAAYTKKKNALKAYPARLLKLLDKQGRCVACMQNSPDGFSLLTVTANGDTDLRQWSEAGETAAKDKLKRRELKEYYILHSKQLCHCCNETPAEERSDWDSDLEINRDGAIHCTWDAASNTVKCSG